MVEEKAWYKSRTIWGSLVAVAASLLGGFGVVVDAQTQTEFVDIIIQFVTVTGALLAIYGRLNATEVISS